MMTACSADPTIVPDIYELCLCLSYSTSYLDQLFEAHFGCNEEAKQTELDDIENTLSEDDDEDDDDIEQEYEDESDDDDDDDDYSDISTDNDEEYDDSEEDDDDYDDDQDEDDEDDQDIPLQLLLDEDYNQNEVQSEYVFLPQTEKYSPVIQHKQDLFFLISMYTYYGDESLQINYFNLLKHYILQYYNLTHLHIDDIISVITSFISTSITFCSNLKHSDYYNGNDDDDDDDDDIDECDEYANYYNDKMKQITFEHNESIIRFNKSRNDYLNVISNQCLIQDINDYDNEKFIINCYILSKGDEMWIGLINKSDFYVKKSIENKSGSLLYYGGRECLIGTKRRWSRWDNGFGAIHGFGDIVFDNLVPYQSGDWITFLIDLQSDNNKSIKIFKNGMFVYETEKLPFKHNKDKDKNDELYFVCTVDDDIDAVFVEQCMYKGQLYK